MRGNILVLGANDRFAPILEVLFRGTTVRAAASALATDGLNADAVLIASDDPIGELARVRAHPCLHSKPVILLAPGHSPEDVGMKDDNLRAVTSTGLDQLDELLGAMGQLVARLQHPSAIGDLDAPAA